MKISLLLELEPFYDIFKTTLSAHYFYQDGLPRVWDQPTTAHEPSTTLYINEHLNCIYQAHTAFASFRQIRKEFRTRTTGGIIKKILQWIYVYMATVPFISIFFSQHRLTVSPKLPLGRHDLLLGGRNVIRIINPKTRLVLNLLKSGSDPAIMRLRINLRSSRIFDFIPQLVSEWGDGFSEQYIDSTPINRLFNSKKKDAAISSTYSVLTRLSCTHCGDMPFLTYAKSLLDEFSDPKFLAIAQDLFSFIQQLDYPKNTSLCFSHGDFQPANLLVDEQGKLWVIDWEGANTRSIFYDAATFFLDLRHPTGLALRIETALRTPPKVWGDELPYLSDVTQKLPAWIGLVILEHFVTIFNESKWFPSTDCYPELYEFIHELHQIKKVLALG